VDPDAHLVFYAIDIEDEPFQTQVQVVNQFGEQTFGVLDPVGLAVPSTKTELPPPEPLDHFKCYDVEDFVGSGDIVSLEDQFSEPFLAQVGYAWDFCNPVEKIHGDMVTPILHPDNHLMLFDIYHETTFACWEVEVYNQFGLQLIEVGWPFGLAVPTHKLFPGDHDPPAGLDHFLIYEAWGPPINVVVSLDDQFHLEPEVLVMEPVLFGIPVVKTHEDIVTPIGNERMHLVFYEISGDSYEGFVAAENQFGGWELPVWSPELLAVPSLKWGYWPLECPY
jgi:hypothetical protein